MVSRISNASITPVKLRFPRSILSSKVITPQKTTGVPGKISSLLLSKNLKASVSVEMTISKCLSLYF